MADLIFLCIILGMTFLAGRKGLFRLFAGAFGTIIAYFGAAKWAVPKLTAPAQEILTPLCRSFLSRAAEKSSVLQTVQQPYDATSQNLGQLLKALHVPHGLTQEVGDKIAETGHNILNSAAEIISKEIAPLLVFLLAFFLIKLAIWVAAQVFSADIPLVSGLNRTAGCLLGACSGVLVVVVLCVGLTAFAPQGVAGVLSQESISQSIIGSTVFRFIR